MPKKESDHKPAFGFMFNDGVISPHPPISRALGIVRKALEDSGYQVCTEPNCQWRRKPGLCLIPRLASRLGATVQQRVFSNTCERNIISPPLFMVLTIQQGPMARGGGCLDAYKAIQSSGEPMVPEIDNVFPGGKLLDPIPLPDYEEAVLYMKDFRNRYNDHWESSAEDTHNGK